MKKQKPSDFLYAEKRHKTPSRKSCIGREPTSEKIKLLKRMLDTLCTVHLSAKSHDFSFLSYLAEMAALEAQREIGNATSDQQQTPKALDEHRAASETPLKAVI